jgi:hypothetical protein
VYKTLAHATSSHVMDGRTTEWERRGNHLADHYAKLGAVEHGMTREHLRLVAAAGNLARQSLRWSAEAFVLFQKMLPVPVKPARKANGPARRRQACRRARPALVKPGAGPGERWVWKGADEDPGTLGHQVRLATVVDEYEDQQRGVLAFCGICGAYFWKRVGRLAGPCLGVAIRAQPKRLARGLFPAAAARYRHLSVVAVRNPEPAELVELARQLQSAGGRQTIRGSGSAVPTRRIKAKSGPASWRRAEAAILLGAYGLSSEDLKRLAECPSARGNDGDEGGGSSCESLA